MIDPCSSTWTGKLQGQCSNPRDERITWDYVTLRYHKVTVQPGEPVQPTFRLPTLRHPRLSELVTFILFPSQLPISNVILRH